MLCDSEKLNICEENFYFEKGKAAKLVISKGAFCVIFSKIPRLIINRIAGR